MLMVLLLAHVMVMWLFIVMFRCMKTVGGSPSKMTVTPNCFRNRLLLLKQMRNNHVGAAIGGAAVAAAGSAGMRWRL